MSTVCKRFCSVSAKPFSAIPGPGIYNHVGSLLSVGQLDSPYPWGDAKLHRNDSVGFCVALHKKYGDISRFGFPGMGKGSNGEVIFVYDPREYMKVIEKSPRYPRGILNMEWPFIRTWQHNNMATQGFFGIGEEWWRLRQQLQKNFTAPKDARRYVLSMVQASKLAVEGADSHEDFERYLQLCSMDMICAITLGRLTETADPRTYTDPRNLQFVEYVSNSNKPFGAMVQSMKEILIHKMGIDSKLQKGMHNDVKLSCDVGSELIAELREKWEKGDLTDMEKSSYAVAFFNREDNVELTEAELQECVLILMFAGVDTTSSILTWLILNLGQHQEVQQKLREEILNVLGPDAGIPSDIQFQAQLPYLSACIRESYRLNPAVPSFSIKTATEDLVLNGYHVPADTYIIFQNTGYNVSEKLMDDPFTFRPERWLAEEVEGRKGTDREILDHRLLSNGFSHGARMCPGARVAALEIVTFMTEFVRRWNVEVDPNMKFEMRQKLTSMPHPALNDGKVKVTSLKQKECKGQR